MNQVIENLLALQELDVRLIALRKRLAAGPARLEAKNEELERHRVRHDEAARRAKEAMRQAERKNGEVDGMDKKINDLALKQNTARSNKEYEAFKTEIAGHKADRGILEEEALQAWSVGEDRENEAKEEEDKVAQIEAALVEEQKAWEAEAVGYETELGEMNGIRAERSSAVSSSWRGTYDRLVESQGVPAVVAVVEQYCQGCQMHITIHDVTRAWKGSEVVQCKSCNRILYAETL